MFSILSMSLYISLNSKRVRFARPSTSVLRGRLETQRSQALFGCMDVVSAYVVGLQR